MIRTPFFVVPNDRQLDEVDISWEIGGDFHANSLLANLWLVPDLHDDLHLGVASTFS